MNHAIEFIGELASIVLALFAIIAVSFGIESVLRGNEDINNDK